MELRKSLTLVLVGAVAILGGFSYYYYHSYQSLRNNPQQVSQQETKDLVATVSKLIILPTGEDPTVATVADPSKLKDQPFFANAQTGDKVLIYANAKKAILYSPSENKIVEVAPLNIGNSNSNK